jgi:hypothetical protein
MCGVGVACVCVRESATTCMQTLAVLATVQGFHSILFLAKGSARVWRIVPAVAYFEELLGEIQHYRQLLLLLPIE